MSSIKYYAVSFGVLMAMTGSAIVLADEIDNEPQTDEVSYVFEDAVPVDFIDEDPIVQESTETMEEEEVEMLLPETMEEEKPVEEITDPIVVEEALQEDPLYAPSGIWGSDENGTYYEISGERLKSIVTDIDGYYYGFNSSGYLYKDTSFVLNPYYYRAKADGKLYVNEWFFASYGDYYFGAEGKGANGVVNIDGTDYYFKDSWKAVNTAFEYNGNPYFVDESGTFIMMMPGWNNFTESNGTIDTYLVANGYLIRGGVFNYLGDYYYFNDNGRLARNTSNYVNANPAFSVRSKKDGKLYVNEWYHEKDYGYSYYYGEGGHSAQGFTSVNGKNYYFGNDGQLYQDRMETIDGHVYVFQEDGSYSLAKEGWNDTTSYRYYVKNGNKIYSNIIEDGGEQYYLRNDGRLLIWDYAHWGVYTDANFTPIYVAGDRQGRLVKNEFLFGFYFGSDGKTLPNGFHTIDGYDYYTENGIYYKDTIRNINGTNYIFDITGAASIAKEGFTTNIHTYYVLNGELANGIYDYEGRDRYFMDGIMQTNGVIQISDTQSMVALPDGILIKNGWYSINYPKAPLYIQGTVYADNEGMLVQGLQKIDGKTYIFGVDEYTPYILNQNSLFKYGGKWYYADSNGVATIQSVNNGWINKGGNDVFYVRNGELVKNEIITLDGNDYVIDADGRLVKNGFWEEYNPEFHIYRTDAAGRIVKNAWVQVNDGLKTDGEYYFNGDGKGLEGWQTVEGHTFYFDNGRVLNQEIRQINGQLYRFGEAGSQHTTIVPDGVYDTGRSLQVVRNGVLVKKELYPYQGSYYLIDGVGSSLWDPGVQIIDYTYNRYNPLYVYATNENAVAQFTKISTNYGLDFFAASDATLRDGLVNYMGNMYAVVRDEYTNYGFRTWAAKNVPVTIKGVDYYADENGILHQAVNHVYHSLSLDGNIGVNFYFDFTNEVLNDEGAMVNFTVDGNTITHLVKDLSLEASLVKSTVEVTSIQMASQIQVDVLSSSGNTVYSEKYSVKQYCDNKLADSGIPSELRNLMEALLNYGGYAQIYFNKDVDHLANKDLTDTDVSDVTAATLKPYESVKTGSVNGLTMNGSTLSLDSMTTIKHYFTVGSGHTINEYTFKVNNKTVTPVKSGSMYYIEIPNIASNDLDTLYTLRVGNFVVKYYALSYAYSQLNKSNGNTNLQNALRALYKYNQAANAYLGD